MRARHRTPTMRCFHGRPSRPIAVARALAAVFAFLLLAGPAARADDVSSSTNPEVRVTTNMGSFVIELRPDRAPLTVADFLRYVHEGFYSNTLFHRVVANFVIQGGGHEATAPYALKPTYPPVDNESGNGLQNKRGAVGLARAASPHTGNAQFYINRARPAADPLGLRGLRPGGGRHGRRRSHRRGTHRRVRSLQVRCAAEAGDHPERRGHHPAGPHDAAGEHAAAALGDAPIGTAAVVHAAVRIATVIAVAGHEPTGATRRARAGPDPACRLEASAAPGNAAERQQAAFRCDAPSIAVERGRPARRHLTGAVTAMSDPAAPGSPSSRAGRRLFVSDVHLDTSAPEAQRQFLEFLRAHAAGARALYILGDLFEMWVGDDDAEGEKSAVLSALSELTGRGTACFLLHGNRDFLIGQGFCERTGCQLMPDPVIAELDGERVLLTHGDALCTDDHSYQELRTIVRDRAWQRRFLSLPLPDRQLLANEVRAGSRAHTARTIPKIMDVNSGAVIAAFKATRVRRIIHGHTHRPAVHDALVDGQPVQRIVLGAWYEQGSYLACEGGRYELRSLPR
jgi:UDP-2,3-diacylglucosamine hydrolase